MTNLRITKYMPTFIFCNKVVENNIKKVVSQE